MKMRRDFCAFLSRLFEPSKATVSFEIERVKITRASGHVSTTLRAVLRLQVEKVNPVKASDEDVLRRFADKASRSVPSTPKSVGSKADTVVDINESRQASAETPVTINQQSESYGSDSEVLRVTRVQSQGNENSHYSPYGDANDLIEAQFPSIILGVPFDEQRHPNRSTPVPEGKRTSPEEYFRLSTETEVQIPRKEALSEYPLLQNNITPVPIGYVNTAYGDLQSVMSALSDPQMDESTIASLSNRLFLQGAQQKSLQKGTVNKSAPAIETPSDHVDQQDWNKKLLDHSTTSKPNFQPGGAFRPPPKSPEKSVPHVNANRELNSGGCSFWDSFVASMCDVVYHVPSHAQPSSHASTMAMPVASVDGFQTVNKIPMADGNPGTLHNFGNVEKEFYRRYNESNDWVQAPSLAHPLQSQPEIRMSDNLGSPLSRESPMFEAAKSMGQSISNQFDDLVKYAFDAESKATRSHTGVAKKGSQKLPSKQIAEQLPEKMRSAQREVGQHLSEPSPVRRSGSSDERGRKSSDIIATKNSRRSEMHTAKTSIVPAPNKVERMELPPREPRRARVQEPKLAIARKKSTASSYHRSNDLIIGSHTPCSEKSTISKAKVRAGSVSPNILPKQVNIEY
jgi:hypothetical protein